MLDWEAVLKLKTGRLGLRRKKVGFCFEWKAWLIAYDVFDEDPEEFNKRDPDEQMNALAYGAAMWYAIKKRRKFGLFYEDICKALGRATLEENKKLAAALKFAQWPEWFKPGEKKKVRKNPR
jgi:hypothetical protein